MKVFLDNGIPPQLRLRIMGGHEVITSWYLNWMDLLNGDLLKTTHEAPPTLSS